ncbi:hypothetical protein [Hymenobacter terrenus]|uniref:hypothetical protein n=1 Tax=Hymenobacter terrenus TaxID=1629124 RepID=UPI0012E08A88|nr:hypothetical protein [Hymenobacter terrenus]
MPDSTAAARWRRLAIAAARTYEWLDTKLLTNAATLYYRLRQVDLDGTADYSPVRTVARAVRLMVE